MKKLFSFILIVLLGGAGGWWYLKNEDDAKEPKYMTELVSVGELKQTVTATGQLNPVLNIQVGSQISGNIQKLYVDFNSPVKAGQVIAQLDPSVYKAIMNQAEGELKNAKAVLELATLTADRKSKLVSQKTAAQADLDGALAALHQAEAMVQIKTANLNKTKADLDNCTIYAPVDGIVISRNVNIGQTVAATMNAPVLFTIANDLHKMQIDANVAEGDIGSVEVGQSVDFTVDAYPYRVFHGKVIQIRNAPINVQNVVTYDTVIEVNNEDLKLKPGMTANVSINIAERDASLKIPNAALRFRMPGKKNEKATHPVVQATEAKTTGGKTGRVPAKITRTVYVLDANDQPQPVQIKVGIGDGISTEVLEGLKENDRVVVGLSMPATTPAPTGSSPFGGPPRRF